mmetsp:Transcript_49413/g.107602  ORF Transcript_49413/g.107602 Transcript_49413/m.107602 type:complete len:634 (-) Transcript_49413:203-2104(-)
MNSGLLHSIRNAAKTSAISSHSLDNDVDAPLIQETPSIKRLRDRVTLVAFGVSQARARLHTWMSDIQVRRSQLKEDLEKIQQIDGDAEGVMDKRKLEQLRFQVGQTVNVIAELAGHVENHLEAEEQHPEVLEKLGRLRRLNSDLNPALAVEALEEAKDLLDDMVAREPPISKPLWSEGLEERLLPSWAYDKRVAMLYERLEQERLDRRLKDPRARRGLRVPPLACTAGAGIRWATLALVSNTIFFLLVPYIAYLRSSCNSLPGGDASLKGFATCDDWPLFVMLGFFGLLLLLVQWKSVQVILLPRLDICRDFGFLGIPFNRLPFIAWMLAMSALTFRNLLDVMTNGEVLGRVLATRQCESYDKIADVWSAVMSQSVFRHIPFLCEADFANVVLGCYLAGLLGPFYALYACVPLTCDVDYDVGMGKQYKFEYPTLSDSHQNHGAALMVMGAVTRMEAVVFKDLDYAKVKMVLWWEEGGRGWELRYLHLAKVEVARSLVKFILIGLMTNAVHTNVQVSLIGIVMSTSNVGYDKQVLFSIAVSILGMLYDFPEALDVLSLARTALRDLGELSIRNIVDEAYRKTVRQENVRLKRYIVTFLAYLVLYLMLALYAFAKLIALVACEHHLWNVTGCVEY